jgi:hypothetical protein
MYVMTRHSARSWQSYLPVIGAIIGNPPGTMTCADGREKYALREENAGREKATIQVN